MEKVSSIVNKKRKLILKVLFGILIFVGIFYAGIAVYSYNAVAYYDDKILPEVYLGEKDLSEMSITDTKNYINSLEEEIKNKQVIFTENGKEYQYTLNDLGVSIDKDKLYDDITSYQKQLSFTEKIKKVFNNSTKKVFTYEYTFNTNSIKNFLTELKTKTDRKQTKEKLSVDKNHNVKYVAGESSYSLNVDESVKAVEKNIYNIDINNKIELVGDTVEAKKSNLSTIDTKTSSFTTTFNNYTNSRGDNIRKAVREMNGTILQPGEIFSFYDATAMKSTDGYYPYLGVIGNGICQVATTVYNATLLGGLDVIARSAHGEQMPYVDGGLDATVMGGDNGPLVDYRFKNNYKYPLYISAYTIKGKIYVDFWSNSKAMNGYTYKTKSVKIGTFAFKAYLQKYKNGKLIKETYLHADYYKDLLII